MELLEYLRGHFLSEAALLDVCAVGGAELSALQARGVMPHASYRLRLAVECESFFGPHAEQHSEHFYAKGYASWLGTVRTMSADAAFDLFCARYRRTIAEGAIAGHASPAWRDKAASLDHLRSEWSAFLDGTYGLCTRTGLPEDVAAKELAVAVITTLVEQPSPNLDKLTAAVRQLDRASSPFAPHERARSSRHRLVDEVRRRYQLPSGA